MTPNPQNPGAVAGEAERDAFEAFMSYSRRNKGVKKAAQLLNRFEDGTYINEHVQRHWWTWQQARASQSDGTSGGPKTLILLSSGEYSDYGVMGAFRPMKAFNVGDALDAFKAQWKPEPGAYSYEYGPSDFAAWLAKEGYIEDAPTEEIHLGSYGDIDPSPETRKLTFSAPTQGENHVG